MQCMCATRGCMHTGICSYRVPMHTDMAAGTRRCCPSWMIQAADTIAERSILWAGGGEPQSGRCHWVPQACRRSKRRGSLGICSARGTSLSLLPQAPGCRGPFPLGWDRQWSPNARTGCIWCHTDPGTGAEGPLWPFQRDIRSEPGGLVRRFLRTPR